MIIGNESKRKIVDVGWHFHMDSTDRQVVLLIKTKRKLKIP